MAKMTKKGGPVSTALKKALRKSELTPYAIAKETGIQRDVLTRFLNGERGLQLETVDRLAKFFGLDIVPTKD